MASGDFMLQREGVREGLCVRCACVVCVYLEGGNAGEDKREKRSAQYICLLYFTAHYSVTLTGCLLSILYVVSRVWLF